MTGACRRRITRAVAALSSHFWVNFKFRTSDPSDTRRICQLFRTVLQWHRSELLWIRLLCESVDRCGLRLAILCPEPAFFRASIVFRKLSQNVEPRNDWNQFARELELEIPEQVGGLHGRRCLHGPAQRHGPLADNLSQPKRPWLLCLLPRLTSATGIARTVTSMLQPPLHQVHRYTQIWTHIHTYA